MVDGFRASPTLKRKPTLNPKPLNPKPSERPGSHVRSHLPVHEAQKHQPLQLKVRCYLGTQKPTVFDPLRLSGVTTYYFVGFGVTGIPWTRSLCPKL